MVMQETCLLYSSFEPLLAGVSLQFQFDIAVFLKIDISNSQDYDKRFLRVNLKQLNSSFFLFAPADDIARRCVRAEMHSLFSSPGGVDENLVLLLLVKLVKNRVFMLVTTWKLQHH